MPLLGVFNGIRVRQNVASGVVLGIHGLVHSTEIAVAVVIFVV